MKIWGSTFESDVPVSQLEMSALLLIPLTFPPVCSFYLHRRYSMIF